jgi:hypothetical protein
LLDVTKKQDVIEALRLGIGRRGRRGPQRFDGRDQDLLERGRRVQAVRAAQGRRERRPAPAGRGG